MYLEYSDLGKKKDMDFFFVANAFPFLLFELYHFFCSSLQCLFNTLITVF